MVNIIIDVSEKGEKIKPMNAVNNGPYMQRSDQSRGNSIAYRQAKIPFARNHDAAFDSKYGGEHSVDITAIFPNFDADVNAESSYDFVCTDKLIADTLSVGTEIFYRLGNKIEHGVKKYGTKPPVNFKKWAEICEHIIAHYNSGWANGFNYGIQYWEIWNEPDLYSDDSDNKPTWGGTKRQFFDFYEIAAKHLKEKFPDLKIGGPALAYNEEWADEFLCEMRKRKVPIDFFSWHAYGTIPVDLKEKGERLKRLLNKYGYSLSESICDEWNYVGDWGAEYVEKTVKKIHGIHGAIFVSDCMNRCQQSNTDMLMYYDARACVFNGMFDYYTLKPLKGYYPFCIWSKLNEYGQSVKCEVNDDLITAVSSFKDNKLRINVCYFNLYETQRKKRIKVIVKNLDVKRCSVYILDEKNDLCMKKIKVGKPFKMYPDSQLYFTINE